MALDGGKVVTMTHKLKRAAVVRPGRVASKESWRWNC
jgi:hypothetical protein